MFVRAFTEYGEKNTEINTLVKSPKHWVQQLIFQCLGSTKECEEVSLLIMFILEGMIAQTALFSADFYDIEYGKKYILALVDSLD